MIKKVIFSIIILALIGGGFFYWQNNQADVRELNKTLPEKVKVVKSLFGDEYKVVNGIDGYEFKIPPEWQGIKEIEYIPEREVEGYRVASVGLGSKSEDIFSIDLYFVQQDIDLTQWADKLFQKFGLEGVFDTDSINNFKVVKTIEKKYLGGTYVYFLESNSKIYVFNSSSEEFIQYIISHGKW